MKTVLVLFGGVSSEHDVSLLSAQSVIDHIPAESYALVLVGITKQGRWLRYRGDAQNLPEDGWLRDPALLSPALLSPDTTQHGLLLLGEDGPQTLHIDVAFPVLHGNNGEDGTVQGLLTLAGIPFVGCDLLSGAMCMDKAVTNTLLDSAGIAQAKWRAISRSEFADAPDAQLEALVAYLGYPLFVKPANAGSSVGVSKVTKFTELREAIAAALVHDSKIVLEEGISGAEVECAVLGNEHLRASVVGEIDPCNEFYDYAAKYLDAQSALFIPARIPEETAKRVQTLACEAFRVMGCRGMARVDFFVRESDGAVLLNELNTIPGFTSISMYPKLFAHSGLPYPQLLHRLLQLATEA